MLIRKAETKDISDLRRLVALFYKENLHNLKLSFDLETIDKTIKNCIENHICIVAEKDEKLIGVIAGTFAPSLFNDKEIIAQEIIWYVEEKERKGKIGVSLIRTFENVCHDIGAKFVVMVQMADKNIATLNRFYSIRKYKCMEIQYLKGV